MDVVEVDHGRRLTAMSSVGALAVVEGNPASDGDLCLRACFQGVQIDALILQGPPQALDEDVLEAELLAVHRNSDADPVQPGSPFKGSEPAALIGVHHLG